MTTKNKLPFSNQFERGHSFNWAGKWTEGKYYINDEYVTDFVVYDNTVVICRQTHIATEENKPVIIYVNGIPSDVDSPYWELGWSGMTPETNMFLTEEEYEELKDAGLLEDGTIYYTYEDDL